VYILGGESDREIGQRIAWEAGCAGVVSVAGDLTPTQSMDLIRLSNAIVTNDSAPVHMASAVGAPTVALFGPTLPEFGFAPLAHGSEILEQSGLSCRPCTVYGSGVCPVGTLACLKSISVDAVHAAVIRAAIARQRPTTPES
jgi:heptosyltransferase-2